MTAPATQPAPHRSRTVMYAAIGVGLVMALLVLLLLTRDNAEERSTASPLIGKTAPALDGAAPTLSAPPPRCTHHPRRVRM